MVQSVLGSSSKSNGCPRCLAFRGPSQHHDLQFLLTDFSSPDSGTFITTGQPVVIAYTSIRTS